MSDIFLTDVWNLHGVADVLDVAGGILVNGRVKVSGDVAGISHFIEGYWLKEGVRELDSRFMEAFNCKDFLTTTGQKGDQDNNAMMIIVWYFDGIMMMS